MCDSRFSDRDKLEILESIAEQLNYACTSSRMSEGPNFQNKNKTICASHPPKNLFHQAETSEIQTKIS
jgi:hypothetical protein